MNSQRGLSGTLRRTISTARPMIAPSTNDNRQPRSVGKMFVFSASTTSSAPPMPISVMKRTTKNEPGKNETDVSSVPSR
jgi:hypothetical protein